MSALELVVLAVAGGVGAVARFLLDSVVRARLGAALGSALGGLPLGTLVINVTGSFALGLLTGLGLRGAVTSDLVAVLGTGFLGGYTTFSTASYETVRLAQAGRWIAASINAIGALVVCVVAAGLGLFVAGLGS
ncbi:CrcB family protein [Arsenicicoccus piscis]|uniref:Fluoride-specific ion channel FluC n=1 Tax=Arsenicicoccus piscis TaxID=673954 RepID=A0ABQ6HRY9_9MICO|nr:CrcB family protein [Arsenicicoccus piscis]MCH8626340.1 CrcB family protein [Arsenicicoccus piscis]GMA20947.1 hypothetical protein GCM10025862_29680 [Arsenicicoccus piscis]